jgi:hypothetical protein
MLLERKLSHSLGCPIQEVVFQAIANRRIAPTPAPRSVVKREIT